MSVGYSWLLVRFLLAIMDFDVRAVHSCNIRPLTYTYSYKRINVMCVYVESCTRLLLLAWQRTINCFMLDMRFVDACSMSRIMEEQS